MLFSKKKKQNLYFLKPLMFHMIQRESIPLDGVVSCFNRCIFLTYLLVLESCFVFLVLDSSKLISIHRDKFAKFI